MATGAFYTESCRLYTSTESSAAQRHHSSVHHFAILPQSISICLYRRPSPRAVHRRPGLSSLPLQPLPGSQTSAPWAPHLLQCNTASLNGRTPFGQHALTLSLQVMQGKPQAMTVLYVREGAWMTVAPAVACAASCDCCCDCDWTALSDDGERLGSVNGTGACVGDASL